MPGQGVRIRLAPAELAALDLQLAELRRPELRITRSSLAAALVAQHLAELQQQEAARAGARLVAGGLDREQQLALVVQLRGTPGYRPAVQRFAAAQQGLAIAYAARWQTVSIPQQDLQQQAMVGLLEAIALWDPARGARFSVYAVSRMRYQVSRYIQKKEQAVHTPQNVLQDRRVVTRAERALQQELGRAPSAEEIQARSGLSGERYQRAVTRLSFETYEGG